MFLASYQGLLERLNINSHHDFTYLVHMLSNDLEIIHLENQCILHIFEIMLLELIYIFLNSELNTEALLLKFDVIIQCRLH